MLRTITDKERQTNLHNETQEINSTDLPVRDEVDANLIKIIDKLIEENNKLITKQNEEQKHKQTLFAVVKTKNLHSAVKKVITMKKQQCETSLLIEEIIDRLHCGKPSHIVSKITKLQDTLGKYSDALNEIIDACGVDNYYNAKEKIKKLVSNSQPKAAPILLKPSWIKGKKGSEVRVLLLCAQAAFERAILRGVSKKTIREIFEKSITYNDFVDDLHKVFEPKLSEAKEPEHKAKLLEQQYQNSFIWLSQDSKINKILSLETKPGLSIEWERIECFRQDCWSEKIDNLIENSNKWKWSQEQFDTLQSFADDFKQHFPEIKLLKIDTWEEWSEKQRKRDVEHKSTEFLFNLQSFLRRSYYSVVYHPGLIIPEDKIEQFSDFETIDIEELKTAIPEIEIRKI